MKKVIKELLFFLLFLAVVLLRVGSLLYEYIPNQVISGITKYEQNSGTKQILSQIQINDSVDDNKKEDKTKNEDTKLTESDVVTSYEVASDNVAEYLNSSNEYETGKNYPFYDYTQAKTATSEESEEEETKKDSSSSKETTDDSNKKLTVNSTTSDLRDTSDSSKTQK